MGSKKDGHFPFEDTTKNTADQVVAGESDNLNFKPVEDEPTDDKPADDSLRARPNATPYD